MERPKDITAHPSPSQNKLTLAAISVVIIFHLVGLIGLLSSGSRPLFLQLVPYHLLLMALILFFSHNRFDRKYVFFIGLIVVLGFTAEWIGIHKGWLFGNYAYSNILGPKLDGVPLIIGINWFILIYATGVTMQYSRIRYIWVRVITGALLLVLLDVLIEPVAIHLDYWHWTGNATPLKNYACWFIISLVMLFLFEKFNFKKQGLVGFVLLISQFIFFAVLQ